MYGCGKVLHFIIGYHISSNMDTLKERHIKVLHQKIIYDLVFVGSATSVVLQKARHTRIQDLTICFLAVSTLKA